MTTSENGTLRPLAEFSLPSRPGNEREAMERVGGVVEVLHLPQKRLDRLKTAVAEATMNAMEHGNEYRTELMVGVEVLASDTEVTVRITDEGGGPVEITPQTPDLEAKLGGGQTPRGWGLFLIQNMVDELRVTGDESRHTIELVLRLNGGE